MNKRIEEFAAKCTDVIEGTLDGAIKEFDYKKFAEMIVKECANAADMAYDARLRHIGDYVGEQLGYGEEHGITAWRCQ